MDELKPCPFCGKKVTLIKEPLWHGSHGYYGSYEYVVKCRNPECRCQIYLGKNNTIYYDDETAQRNAIKAWNRRVEKSKDEML